MDKPLMNRNLIGYRNMMGFRQLDVAEKLGIGETTYWRKENGLNDFTQTEMEKITSVLNEAGHNLTMQHIFLRT